MSNMLRRFIFTLAVLQVRLLQPSSASSETAKTLLEMESSELAHADPSGRYNTKTDVIKSEKLPNLISNTRFPMLSSWRNTLTKNMEHFPVGSTSRDQKTFSRELIDRIRQGETNRENREFQATELSTVGKPSQRRGLLRKNMAELSFAVQTNNSDDLPKFIQTVRSGESISVRDGDDDKSCDYENTNVSSGQLENMSKCKVQGSSEASRKRSKRGSRNGGTNHQKGTVTAPRRLFDAAPKLPGLEEENNVDGRFSDDDIFTRTAGVMPLNLGGGEGEMDNFYRPERDRLSRMPVTFGKRGTNERLNTFLKRMIDDVLNRHFLELDDDNSFDSDDTLPFIRTSKGSLHRMPMSFGKRAKALLNNINDEESNLMPVAYTKSMSSTQNHVAPHIERSEIDPSRWRQQNSWKDKPARYEFPENEDFIRLQRSKLERMPLTFGKRHHVSNNINGGVVNVHDIKQRSRLERMPVSFGKREIIDGTMVYLSVLGEILSTGGSDALKPGAREALRDLLFESSTPKEAVQTND